MSSCFLLDHIPSGFELYITTLNLLTSIQSLLFHRFTPLDLDFCFYLALPTLTSFSLLCFISPFPSIQSHIYFQLSIQTLKMAPSNSNNSPTDGTQVPGLKSEVYAATIDHRNMLEEFGRKYHALGVEAGHAMGVEAGLAQAEEEIELRIATAMEDSQEIITELIEKRTKETEVDANLANEARK
jgi:hypothetical protein